jgi:hypothetical protein
MLLENGRVVQVVRDPDTRLQIVMCPIKIVASARQSEVLKRHVFRVVD